MGNIVKMILAVGLVCLIVAGCGAMCGESGPRGDGKTKCRNCGRSPVVYAGFCSSCGDGFLEWQRKNGY